MTLGPVTSPPPVHAGDRVGVAALSGPVDPANLEAGLAALADLGYEPVPADNLALRCRLTAGDAAERLAAFHRLAADETVRAVVFARGGHGSLALMPGLDWDMLAARPRAYVGYSDLTPFLLEFARRTGLAAFHGPMVAVDLARGLAPEEARWFRAALAGEALPPVEVETLFGGAAVSAPLVGGCLTMLGATLGTAWAADLDGAVFFWEDVDEPLYRLDRLLTQLELAGALAGIRGMVVGRLEFPAGDGAGAEVGEWLAEWGSRLGVPVARGCASGHCVPNLMLPLGTTVRLDPAAGRLLLTFSGR